MQKKRRLLLPLFLIGLFACQSSTRKQGESTPHRPNILWIVADDLGTDLGCYGEKAVSTPHLDKLASQGVRYENVFTVTAVCSPSRSGLITGMYPVSIGCHQHRQELNNLAEDPAYADTLARMRTALDRWLADADKGAYPENPGEIEFAEKLMEDRFRQNMAREGLSPEISDEDYLTWWMEKLDVGDMK